MPTENKTFGLKKINKEIVQHFVRWKSWFCFFNVWLLSKILSKFAVKKWNLQNTTTPPGLFADLTKFCINLIPTFSVSLYLLISQTLKEIKGRKSTNSCSKQKLYPWDANAVYFLFACLNIKSLWVFQKHNLFLYFNYQFNHDIKTLIQQSLSK